MELWIPSTAILVVVIFASVKFLIGKLQIKLPRDIDELFEQVETYSHLNAVKVRFFHKKVVFLFKPELIQKVLASEVCLEKPLMIYKFMGVKDGILIETVSKWRYNRRYFSHSFAAPMVQNFIPTFCSVADKIIESIAANYSDGETFDVNHYTERCMVKMILASSFDTFTEDIEVDGEAEIDNIVESVKLTSSIFSNRVKYFPWYFDFIFKFSKTYQKVQERRKRAFKMLFETLKRKEKNRTREPPFFVENEFMNRILLMKDKIELDHMHQHMYSVIGAGYETTGNASAHCILFLALHPEVQEKAYQEILSVYPSEDCVIDSSSLARLDYLERVIKETLRFASVVPNIGREVLEDFEIEPGRIAKKGTIYCIDIYSLHRRKSLWGEDADKFDPDRFLPENFEGKKQFYIPFSAGKRNCLGPRYAASSFKVIIMKLLRSFKFSTELKLDEIKFNRQIALKLVGPHSVQIERRRKFHV